jgi:hypothetical protein
MVEGNTPLMERTRSYSQSNRNSGNTTDASSHGWGAAMDRLQVQGVWNQRVAYKHSNYRELLTILLAVHSFLPQLKGKVVQILTDNVTAAAYVNFQGGQSVEMTDISMAIWDICVRHNISISAKHLAGKLNQEADQLSRRSSQYEWMLHPNLFRYLDRLWGPHTVDRFASMATTQINVLGSIYRRCGRVSSARLHGLRVQNNFVNPPFRLIGRVLDVVCAQKGSGNHNCPQLARANLVQTVAKNDNVCTPIRIPNNNQACLEKLEVAPVRLESLWAQILAVLGWSRRAATQHNPGSTICS